MTHHTAIAQDASSGERSPIAAPNAVANARGAKPMNAPIATTEPELERIGGGRIRYAGTKLADDGPQAASFDQRGATHALLARWPGRLDGPPGSRQAVPNAAPSVTKTLLSGSNSSPLLAAVIGPGTTRRARPTLRQVAALPARSPRPNRGHIDDVRGGYRVNIPTRKPANTTSRTMWRRRDVGAESL